VNRSNVDTIRAFSSISLSNRLFAGSKLILELVST
jgi:hypothetical protein